MEQVLLEVTAALSAVAKAKAEADRAYSRYCYLVSRGGHDDGWLSGATAALVAATKRAELAMGAAEALAAGVMRPESPAERACRLADEKFCRHGNLRRECETCDYEATAEAFAP